MKYATLQVITDLRAGTYSHSQSVIVLVKCPLLVVTSCVTVLRLHVNIPQKLSMGAFIVSVRSSIEPLLGLTNDSRASERLMALHDKTT